MVECACHTDSAFDNPRNPKAADVKASDAQNDVECETHRNYSRIRQEKDQATDAYEDNVEGNLVPRALKGGHVVLRWVKTESPNPKWTESFRN
jgi:hypothetical protein